jgi:hypothetical protein
MSPSKRTLFKVWLSQRTSTEKAYTDIYMDIIYYCNYDDICRLTAIRVWDTENFRCLVFVAHSTFEIAEKRRFTICQWAGRIIYEVYCSVPISVAVRFKAWVWGRSRDRTAGSNHAGGMYVRILWVLYVVGYMSLRRALHSSCRVLPNVMCLKWAWSRNLDEEET